LKNGTKFCPVTKKLLHFEDQENFQNCHQVWKTTNIRDKVLDWKAHLLKNPDPFWYKESDFSPLDLDNPELDITIPMFVDREAYTNKKVIIKSLRRTLFEGVIVNGTIKG